MSFISMINYFSCHFLLMRGYHLLCYTLSLRSSISTNNLIPTFRAKTILSLLNLGIYFLEYIFLRSIETPQYSSYIYSIQMATF